MTDVSTLVCRIERLERERRWWRSAGIVGVCAVGTLAWLGATSTRTGDELRTRRVTIVDAKGTVRMTLGMDTTTPSPDVPIPAIRLYEANGTNRAELLVRGDGAPFLTLRDSKGNTTAQLDVSGPGLAPSLGDFGGLVLQGPRRGPGTPRAEITLGFKSADEPQIRMERRDGTVVWKAP